MASPKELLDKFKRARNDIDNIVSRSIDKNSSAIYDLIREQLSDNEKGDGSNIGSYSRTYKGRGGYSGFGSFPKSQGGGYNMNWSGELFSGFSHKYSNGILTISNLKADSLASKYGNNLAHANKQSKIKINNFVNKDINEYLSKL